MKILIIKLSIPLSSLAAFFFFVRDGYLAAIITLAITYFNIDWIAEREICLAFDDAIPNYPHRTMQALAAILSCSLLLKGVVL